MRFVLSLLFATILTITLGAGSAVAEKPAEVRASNLRVKASELRERAETLRHEGKKTKANELDRQADDIYRKADKVDPPAWPPAD